MAFRLQIPRQSHQSKQPKGGPAVKQEQMAKKVTDADLLRDARNLCSISPTTVERTVLGMSVGVLKHLLGAKWVEKNLDPTITKVDKTHRAGRALFQSGKTAEQQ